ncbi:MAG: SDR family oxidoreductase [Victivallales bacterium]|nr:SDR family oxidoreductase [Victivallales bacterium]
MPSDYLQLEGKCIVLTGVANRRSVAWAVAQELQQLGAKIIYVFRDEALLEKNRALVGQEAAAVTCNVEDEADMAALPGKLAQHTSVINGFVHSIAFANYSQGLKPFHSTLKQDFLQAVDISCFSLVAFCDCLKGMFAPDASIVAMSISSTRIASENYGYMGPVKAALDSTIAFLAKSLSQNVSPDIRVNAVGAGLLRTSASAGIPGYIDAYLFAEKAIPRKRALETKEPARVLTFLLSPMSSGINAQVITVDVGMGINYFDKEIVHKVTH